MKKVPLALDLDPEAETASYDTILNAFDNPEAPAGLTDWDMSYLRALYSYHSDPASARAQAASVAGVMSHDRRTEQSTNDH